MVGSKVGSKGYVLVKKTHDVNKILSCLIEADQKSRDFVSTRHTGGHCWCLRDKLHFFFCKQQLANFCIEKSESLPQELDCIELNNI